MRFFFDRCMPVRLARMVSAYEAEHTVRHHDDDSRFNPRTADTEWIAALAADTPPWVVVSGDARILKNKVERAALESAGLKFFCMAKGWMNMQLHEYAWKFIKVWPEITEAASRHKARLFEVSGGKALKVDPLT
jgi:hypothetical protein